MWTLLHVPLVSILTGFHCSAFYLHQTVCKSFNIAQNTQNNKGKQTKYYSDMTMSSTLKVNMIYQFNQFFLTRYNIEMTLCLFDLNADEETEIYPSEENKPRLVTLINVVYNFLEFYSGLDVIENWFLHLP